MYIDEVSQLVSITRKATSLFLVSIRKVLHVILSEAKNLCGPANYEILRRLAPQNDIQEHGFRMETS